MITDFIKTINDHGNCIAGNWHSSGSGQFLEVINKYSQQPLARLPLASLDQIEAVLAGSRQGFAAMQSWSAGQRTAHLERLTAAVAGHAAALSAIITAEAGKPRSYADAELARCQSTLKTAAQECLRFAGEVVPIDYANGEGKAAITKRIPVGPVLCICPFNFPLNLVLHKVAPALAVGCSVIIKPAPQAPLAALALAHLMDACGYPKGSVSVLQCDIPEAESMVRDERVAMVSFTGSDKVGWHLKGICGRKRISLELGGNAAAIVAKGADIGHAAEVLATGSYLYAGQICISTQRIFVHSSDYDNFVASFSEATHKLKIGDPSDPEVSVGPVIDQANLNRIKAWVDEAVTEGAELLWGGQIIDVSRNLYQPTLLTKTRPGMKVRDEEVFGPVAIVEPVDCFADAIAQVNHSRFGLQAGVFTDRLAEAKAAFDQLEVGGVIINNAPGFRIDNMPYGGVKHSGFGREGLRYAMEEMTEIRLLVF